MRSGTRRGAGLLAMLVVAVQLATAIPAAAADIGPGLHWARQRNPFQLEFGDNVGRAWDNELRQAASGWGKSSVVNTRVVGGRAGASMCSPRNNRSFNKGRVEVCDGRYGSTGWLGLTYVFVEKRSRHIVGARVFINDSYFQTREYNDPRAKRHTMAHELGHSLGLQHANGKSVMSDSGEAIFRYDQPTANDYQELRRHYDHGDGNRSTVTGAEAGPAREPDETVTVEEIDDEIELIIVEILAD